MSWSSRLESILKKEFKGTPLSRVEDLLSQLINGLGGANEENANKINELNDEIRILKGDGDGSILKMISVQIAKIVNGAPEAFDTLKEIADWIENDQTGAQALFVKINNLQTTVNNKADSTTVNNLSTIISNLQTAVNNKADYTTVSNLQSTVSNLQTTVNNISSSSSYGVVSKTRDGLVPKLPNENTVTKYLRQDGTWAVPPDTDTDTKYSAGEGLGLSGTQFYLSIPRVNNKNINNLPTATRVLLEEYSNSAPNTPSAIWLHVMSFRSLDAAYGTQLALGMTGDGVYYRKYASNAWGSWYNLLNPPNAQVAARLGTGTVGGPNVNMYLNGGSPALGNAFVPTSGGSFTNTVRVEKEDPLGSGYSYLVLGGSGGSKAAGALRVYTKMGGYSTIVADPSASSNTLKLPIGAGTLQVASGSSKRIKKNVRNMSKQEAENLLDLEIIKFDYIDGFWGGKKDQCGVIAEDVIKIIPEAVNIHSGYDETKPVDEENNLPPEVDYRKFIPYLIKMVQIQNEKIEELMRKLS